MSKNLISQALELVDGQITKRNVSSIARVRDASLLLSDLSKASERLGKSWDGVKEIPNEFRKGVVEVVAGLWPLLAGYASNGEEVSMDEQAKAAKTQDEALALFDARFVPAVKAESDAEALGALVVLRELLTKALNWESTGGTNPTVTKDPFQTDKTSETGSVEGLQNAQNFENAPVLRKDEGATPELYWPRDLAKGGFSAASNPAFAAAAAAVAKADEVVEQGWPMDMGRRSRR